MNKCIGTFLLSLFLSITAFANPKGSVDQIVFENGLWRVKGWACQQGLGYAINVNVYVNNNIVGFGPWPTTEYSEPAIHQACGTLANTSPTYRFSIPLNVTPSGQTISVLGVGTSAITHLSQSGNLRLPISQLHPESSISAANKILVYIAHPDDEVLFAPILGKYCSSRSCKVVVATRGGGSGAICRLAPAMCGVYNPVTGYANIKNIRSQEMQVSASQIPAVLEQADLSSAVGANVPAILQRWTTELASLGVNFNSILKNEIDTFLPNAILTFDPRHGTTCHPEHRAIAEAVYSGVQNYQGLNFNKSNLFFLTSKRVDTPIGTGLFPAVPADQYSTTYSAKDWIFSKGKSGWAYLTETMGYHPSQFSSSEITTTNNAHDLDRTVSLVRAIQPDYISTDSRYNICQ